MTMTDTEAKALALVNDTARAMEGLLTLHPVDHVYYTELPKLDVFANALCRVIEREAATEARHAAELREQAERFSEVAAKVSRRLKQSPDANVNWMADLLTPFILPAPDPLVEIMNEMGFGMSKTAAEEFRAAMQARGYEWRKIGEAGE